MFSLLDGEVCVQDAAPGLVGAESREEQDPFLSSLRVMRPQCLVLQITLRGARDRAQGYVASVRPPTAGHAAVDSASRVTLCWIPRSLNPSRGGGTTRSPCASLRGSSLGVSHSCGVPELSCP